MDWRCREIESAIATFSSNCWRRAGPLPPVLQQRCDAHLQSSIEHSSWILSIVQNIYKNTEGSRPSRKKCKQCGYCLHLASSPNWPGPENSRKWTIHTENVKVRPPKIILHIVKKSLVFKISVLSKNTFRSSYNRPNHNNLLESWCCSKLLLKVLTAFFTLVWIPKYL